MSQQETNLTEVYKEVKADSVQAAIELAVKYVQGGKAWIYAVLDYAVGFGVYDNGSFLIRLPDHRESIPLEWRYLQELRIFNRCGELRLARIQEEWCGRFRGAIDDSLNSSADSEYSIDEHQKLWGNVKCNEQVNSMYWSLLASERGTQIWIPIKMDERKEAAIWVKKYMRIPSEADLELVYQTDIRMVDFCLWEERK